MRLLAVSLLLLSPALMPATDGAASVTLSGSFEAAFEGSAYVTAFPGFAVMALASAPLDGQGGWAIPEGESFDYVEVRLVEGLSEGEHALGGGTVALTFARWAESGEMAASFTEAEGTLAVDSIRVVEGAQEVWGSISADLTGYHPATAEEVTSHLDARFHAVPGEIPSP